MLPTVVTHHNGLFFSSLQMNAGRNVQPPVKSTQTVRQDGHFLVLVLGWTSNITINHF